MLYFIQLFINAIVNSSGDEESMDQVHEAPTSGFKIVGDNIDIGIKARYMRSTQFINHSLHYFNSFAVLNRINFQEYSNSPLHICFNEPKKRALLVLPSKQDDETIESNMAVLISRDLLSTCHSSSIPLMMLLIGILITSTRKKCPPSQLW